MKHVSIFLLAIVTRSGAQTTAQTPQQPVPVIANTAPANDRNALHPGAVELGISIGRAFGDVGGALVTIPGTNVPRISGKGGISATAYAGVALTEHLISIVEASFLNGSRGAHDLGGGYISHTNTRALVYDAALEYRFLFRSRTVVPYCGLGVGTDQGRADVLVIQTIPIPPTQTQVGVLAAATQVRSREAAFAPVFLAGLEFFPRKRFRFLCFRVGAKGLLPTGSNPDPIGEASAGIFFVFH